MFEKERLKNTEDEGIWSNWKFNCFNLLIDQQKN